jgi:UDP-glucuronate 4-epimerase
MRVLVTGGAGFIGTRLLDTLTKEGYDAIGIDNYNDYYDPLFKLSRVEHFGTRVYKHDMKDMVEVNKIFTSFNPQVVIHLGAQVGVRDSYGRDRDYHRDNIDATQNIIDACKTHNVEKVIYASTSSVYGGTKMPSNGWVEDDVTQHQLNAYAYTKYVNECQFRISGLHNIGLRFFTVYGPWGRPDMALFNFTRDIKNGVEIEAYNYGNMKRDFTYIDDIIGGVMTVLKNDSIPTNEIFNIGRGKQVDLMYFIERIGKELGKDPIIKLAPRHPADTAETWSNTNKIETLGYKPQVNIEDGVKAFVDWYMDYYNEDSINH